jgi:anion-transporting  ArsA/GET3 family ATPase
LIVEGRTTLEGLSPVVVLLGTGGVGKTTCCAALGRALALSGKRVLLLTVDPARRLEELVEKLDLTAPAGNRGEGRNAECGMRTAEPRTGLAAGFVEHRKVDVRAGFAEYVRRHAPDRETGGRILGSRFFPHLTSKLTALHEYVCMEMVRRAEEEGRFDYIVVDTPPFQYAMHFLGAPERVARMASVADAVVGRGARREGRRVAISPILSRGLAMFLGNSFLGDVLDFVAAFARMWGPIRNSAEETDRLFRNRTSFGLVFVPDERSGADLVSFVAEKPEWLKPSFVIANRMVEVGRGEASTQELVARELAGAPECRPWEAHIPAAAQAAVEGWAIARAIAENQAAMLAKLAAAGEGRLPGPCIMLPALPRGVESLTELDRLAARLLA